MIVVNKAMQRNFFAKNLALFYTIQESAFSFFPLPPFQLPVAPSEHYKQPELEVRKNQVKEKACKSYLKNAVRKSPGLRVVVPASIIIVFERVNCLALVTDDWVQVECAPNINKSCKYPRFNTGPVEHKSSGLGVPPPHAQEGYHEWQVPDRRKPEGAETERDPCQISRLNDLVGARKRQQLSQSVDLAQEYDHLHYEDERAADKHEVASQFNSSRFPA